MAGPNSTTRVQGSSLASEGGGRRNVASQVAATLVDSTPRYLPEFQDSGISGLLNGLKAFNPALEQYQQSMEADDTAKAIAEGAAGQPLHEDASTAAANAFLKLKGMKAAQEDSAGLLAAYENDFDKENGNFDTFVQEHLAEKSKGLTNGAFTAAYGAGLQPSVAKLRAEHLDYRQKAVRRDIESTGLALLDQGVQSYTSAGMPVGKEYIGAIKGHLTGALKVTPERFDELLFDSLSREAQKGNPHIFDALKEDREDGSKGMYYDPKWKMKIDSATIHAEHVAIENHKASELAVKTQRVKRQGDFMFQLYDMQDAGEESKALALLRSKDYRHLFDASEYLALERSFIQRGNREETEEQRGNAVQLQIRALEGSLSPKDILKANVSYAQRQSLMGILRQNRSDARADARESRAEARANAANEDGSGLAKDADYKLAKAQVVGMVVPTDAPASARDDAGVPGRVKQVQTMAQAELARRLRGAPKSEWPAVTHDVITRYTKYANEAAKVQPAGKQFKAAPYKDQAEAAAAYASGGMSRAELEHWRQNLPKRGEAAAPNQQKGN